MQQGLTRLIGRIRNRGCTGSELVAIVRASLTKSFRQNMLVYVHEKCYINTNISYSSFRVFTV